VSEVYIYKVLQSVPPVGPNLCLFILLHTEMFFISTVKANAVSILFSYFLVLEEHFSTRFPAGARDFLLSTAFILVLGHTSLLSN
jgi:hypothetical protein